MGKGIIYLIKSPKSNKVYVGSTMRSINQRFSEHKNMLNQYNNNNTNYTSSFAILKKGNAKLIPIKKFNNITKEELKVKEKQVIDKYLKQGTCVNRYKLDNHK